MQLTFFVLRIGSREAQREAVAPMEAIFHNLHCTMTKGQSRVRPMTWSLLQISTHVAVLVSYRQFIEQLPFKGSVAKFNRLAPY